MPFQYYNAHPRKLSVDDCVKRSITLTTGIPYLEVQKGLNAHKKITGVKTFYNYPNPKSYMENVLGFPCVTAIKNKNSQLITVEEFAKLHPCGRYVVSVSGHWSSCIDGIIYDTWDCGKENVLSYYEITRFEKTPVEKKYCFTVKHERGNHDVITVYDGNGIFATKHLSGESANDYIKSLTDKGFFNYDQIGEYI